MRPANRFSSVGAALLLAAASLAVCGTKTTSTWAASELGKASYSKVLVLARISEDVNRRLLEDAVVKQLKGKKIEALTAYQTLAPEDLANKEVLEAKAGQLGADAGILFTVEGANTQVKGGSPVSVSVGVPVRIGPFGAFVGSSVPLGGGPTSVQHVIIKAQFFHKGAAGPQWIATYDVEAGKDNVRLAEELAKLAVKQLKKAGAIK